MTCTVDLLGTRPPQVLLWLKLRINFLKFGRHFHHKRNNIYLQWGKPLDNREELDKNFFFQVSSPKDNNWVLFDFFAFFTEAEPSPPFWEFLDLDLPSELAAFMTPSLNSSSLRLFDLILGLDEEEKESAWEAEDFGSFDEDWVVELAVASSLSAFGSGIGGRPFSITKYL